MSQIQNFEQLGYTSDHVRREIVYINSFRQCYRGFTWNLEKRCHSKADSAWGYSNNPLNCTETKEMYETRKIRQIDEIIASRKQNQYDFGCFQEIDFCFPEYYSLLPAEEKIPDWLVPSMRKIKEYFMKALISIAFNYHLFEEKELAIIYDNCRLNPVGVTHHLKFKTAWDNKYHLLLITFRDSDNNYVRIGSMHGNYNDDYSESIPILLKQFDNTPIIIGGDMNHPPNYKISNFLVLDENECTNFFTNYATVTGSYTEVKLNDARCNLPKAYDGFIVSHGTVIISGEHKWDKRTTEDGVEYPILIANKFSRKYTIV